MRPQFIARSSIDSLRTGFSEAKRRYMEGDRDWFARRLKAEGGLRDSRFEVDDFVLTQGAGRATREEYSQTDLENVRIIYDAMRLIPQASASDERLWSGLAHTELWDYVQYRRRSEIASGNDHDIMSSFFYMHGVKRSSHVHCLSRLWWAGYLTYDEDNAQDPFWLTDVLVGWAAASNIMLFSSSNFTACRDARLGILEAAKERADAGEKLRRAHIAGACKCLNRMGQMTVIDLLGREAVKAIVSEFFETEEFAHLKM